MIKVVLLGAGNVAIHLAKAFSNAKDIDLVQRYSRSNTNDGYFDKSTPATHDISTLYKADIYIIAITDDDISTFSDQLNHIDGLIVHTSGSIPLTVLKNLSRSGILYPVQTFSKDQEINFDHIPIAIETADEKDMDLLRSLVGSISYKIFEINSSQREKLHLAAVFANNFSNYMFTISREICNDNNISFDILKPLIYETAKKVQTLNPVQAQTGPAKRNDKEVIEKHLSQLNGEQKEIYKLVTRSIIKKYNQKEKLK